MASSAYTGVELIYADAGPSEASAVAAFEKLVFEDKVIGVIGLYAAGPAERVAEKAAEWGVPFLSFSPRQGLLEKGDSIFRLSLTTERQVRALVAYSKETLKAQRFAILFPKTNLGNEFAKAYFDAVQEFGGTITAAESYSANQSDFRFVLENMLGLGFPHFRKTEKENELQLMETKKGTPLSKRELGQYELKPIVDFDVLFIPDGVKALGQIVPALAFYNASGVQLLGPATWNNPQLIARAGQYFENAHFVDMYHAQKNSPVLKLFQSKFRSQYGSAPSSLSALGFDAANAMMMALVGAKGDEEAPENHAEYVERLMKLGVLEGALGVQRWNRSRDVLSELQLIRVSPRGLAYESSVVLPETNKE